MELHELIARDHVILGLRAADKTQVLRELGRRAGNALGMVPELIITALSAREAMGSTGVGQGIAIPHARVDGLKRFFGFFARLERPVDFAAIDERPVDLVFLLLIPAEAKNEHLAALAAVSRRLRDKSVADRLREAEDAGALYDALIGSAAPK
jgi:nitrogen PTS system EIIA component